MSRKRTDAAPGQGLPCLTNHAAVLVCIASDPEVRQRDIAARLGITVRRVQGLLAELVVAGYLTSSAVGRRNRYAVAVAGRLHGPLVGNLTVRDLLGFVGRAATRRPRHPRPATTR